MSELRANVSFSRKVNLGNYETADYQVEVTGIEEGMLASDLEGLIDTIHISWTVLLNAVDKQMTADGVGQHSVPSGADAAWPVRTSSLSDKSCADCGEKLEQTRFRDGTVWSPEQLAAYGRRKHGRILCMTHYREANDAIRRSQSLDGIAF